MTRPKLNNLNQHQFHRQWSVDVDWSTHDDVKGENKEKQRKTKLGTARVRVSAPNKAQAELIAAQMVGSHREMVTGTRVITE